jgi:hypothetical protein
MVRLTIPTGDYSIKTRGSQIEIIGLDQELTREEVATRLGRTERSIDLYRNLPEGHPLKLKSKRAGGRITIMESELTRWLACFELNPDEYPASNRPRKKRRARVALNGRRKIRTDAENTERLSRAA